MSCPKCGYSGHNTVSHWGTGEVECENCRHDYVPVKKSAKEQDKNQSEEIALRFKKPFQLIDNLACAPRDVFVSGRFNDASIGISPIGSVYVGKTSGNLLDNSVRDRNGFIQGKITASGHYTNFVL